MDDHREPPRIPRRLYRLGSPERAAYMARQRRASLDAARDRAIAHGVACVELLAIAAQAEERRRSLHLLEAALHEGSSWQPRTLTIYDHHETEQRALARAVVELLRMLEWAPPVGGLGAL